VSVIAWPNVEGLADDNSVIVETVLAFTVKTDALDVPVSGFTTVTFTGPAEAICAAVTDAVSCVALTKVVDNAVAPQSTVAPETKFVPFTVKLKAGPPALAEDGARLDMVGVETPGLTVIVTMLLVDAVLRVSPL
jgi:hypothetical protein